MSQENVKTTNNKFNDKVTWFKLNIISNLTRKKEKY